MKPSSLTRHSFVVPFLVNLGLTGILFAAISLLPIPPFFQCTYPAARNLSLAVIVTLAIQSFVFTKYRTACHIPIAGIDISVVLLVLWLGTYTISPLGFSNGHIPFAQGFILNRSMRADLHVTLHGTVSLVNGSITEIIPVTLPAPAACIWQSANKGIFDNPRTCAVAYIPPTTSNFDVLNVLVRPACNLPEATEEIKVIVLPP